MASQIDQLLEQRLDLHILMMNTVAGHQLQIQMKNININAKVEAQNK